VHSNRVRLVLRDVQELVDDLARGAGAVQEVEVRVLDPMINKTAAVVPAVIEKVGGRQRTEGLLIKLAACPVRPHAHEQTTEAVAVPRPLNHWSSFTTFPS